MNKTHIASPSVEVNFTCTVDGGVGSLVEIMWSGPVYVDLSDATTTEVSDGVFTSNLTLTNVRIGFSGIYKCTTRYNNSLCTTNSSSDASLVVVLGPPTFINQTESPLCVDYGDNTTLYFEFFGLPSLTDIKCSGPGGEIKPGNTTLGITLERMDNETKFQIRLSINIAYCKIMLVVECIHVLLAILLEVLEQ